MEVPATLGRYQRSALRPGGGRGGFNGNVPPFGWPPHHGFAGRGGIRPPIPAPPVRGDRPFRGPPPRMMISRFSRPPPPIIQPLPTGMGTPPVMVHSPTTPMGYEITSGEYYDREYYGEPMEDGSHSCEVCERDFFTKEQYNKHMSEHRTCNLDGCKFTAHEKIIEVHIRMQHATGLYEKIRNIQSPEEITKWIEERKKKYPSKENIEKRYKQQEDMLQKGLRINRNTNRFGRDKFRFANTGPQQGQHLRRGADRLLKKKKRRQPKPPPKVSLIDEKADWNGNMFPFRGTSELFKNVKGIEKDISDFEDDEWQEHKGITTVKVNNSLGSLMAAYGSDSDDMEETPSVVKNSVLPVVDSDSKIKADCSESNNKDDESLMHKISEEKDDNSKIDVKVNENDVDSDAEPPEEIKINKSTGVESFISEQNSVSNNGSAHSFDIKSGDINKTSNKPKRKRSHQKINRSKRQRIQVNASEPSTSTSTTQRSVDNFPIKFRKRKVTLLEKLLESEIRHERNLLLQCVRYLVQNNFFKDC